MWWCVTVVNKVLQPTKSPWSTNPACVTTAPKTATQSTPENSTLPIKVNAKQQQESQCSLVFNQPFDLGSCANMYSPPKSKSPPIFSLFGPCVDQSQCWSNLRGNPSYNEFRPNPSYNKFILLPTCEPKLPPRSLY